MIPIATPSENFQEKRMKIFGDLVQKYWKGELNTSEDLNLLTEEIKKKYGFPDTETSFVKDHIRIAMGLDPKGPLDFENEIDLMRSHQKIQHPIVAKIEGRCEECGKKDCEANSFCKYEAHVYQKKKGPVIVGDKCLTCGNCISSCDFGSLADKIEFMPVIDLLKDQDTPVYATIAPAAVGQFGDSVTMGQLRAAMKLMGFKDLIEVALFADILTIKEAFEFTHLVQNEDDFFLTSCCCPVWFNLTKKSYPEIYNHMSPSVSPMIASGRLLKKLYPEAKVVFIAPCIAKKAEIKEPELEGAIDYVINFRELQEIFQALEISLEDLPDDDKDQASFGGRIYARTGGVSFSVKSVVNRLEPERLIKLKAKKVDGVKGCKAILDDLSNHRNIHANFIEGMGCNGGCVGGPRTLLEVDKATKKVNEFGEDSLILTPFDNLNVMKILRELGLESIDAITHNETMKALLTRD